MVGYVAHAATVTTKSSAPSHFDPALAKKAQEKNLRARIAQYQTFASSTLASLKPDDRKLLSTQIKASVAHAQQSLDTLEGKNTTVKNILQKILKKSPSAPTSPVFGREDTLLAQKMGLLRAAFHFSATSTVSADLLHKLITATSTKAIQSLQKDFLSQSSVRPSGVNKKVSTTKVVKKLQTKPAVVPKKAQASSTPAVVATSTPPTDTDLPPVTDTDVHASSTPDEVIATSTPPTDIVPEVVISSSTSAIDGESSTTDQ